MAYVQWELFPHEADMGVRGIGGSKEEAFEQAALALTAVITDPGCVAANEPVDLECEAPDDELLFVNWLNALVYEMATRRMLFARFEVSSTAKNYGQKLGVRRSIRPGISRRLKSKAPPARVL